MKDIFFVIASFSAIFLNSNLSVLLGYQNNVTTVAFLPLALFLLGKLLQGKILFFDKKNRKSLHILFLSILLLVFKLTDGQYDMFKTILLFFFIPYTFSIYLETFSLSQKKKLQKIIILLLIVECILSLYERVTYTVLLANEDTYSAINRAGDTWSFRASALFGHPLGNAMLVSVINIFILSSDLPFIKRTIFFILALVALLCFNERGNIIITLIMSIPFFVSSFKKGNKKFKTIFILIGVPLFISSILYIAQSDLGGRLFNEKSGKHDNSTMARLEALNSFAYLNSDELFWGSNNLSDNVASRMNLLAIENGIIAFLLDYGIILGIPLLIILISFQWDKLSIYPIWNKWIILLLFYGIGITNPHLSNPLQWFMFICTYYAFRPIKNIIYVRK